MLIDLKSIDDQGKDYDFTETSEELEGVFADLIGEKPFAISLKISPLGNSYQIQGKIQAEYPEVCSRCGYDIEVPLANKINEIIVIEKKRPRNTAVSQSQQNFNGGPAVTYLNDSELNLKEFLHEMMASGLNLYPVCADKTLCDSRQYRPPADKVPEQKTGHPGFASLKDFKINKH